MTKTVLLLLASLPAWTLTGGVAVADVFVTVQPPFSSSPFSITPGYTASYSPATGINRTLPSGFPQPNCDIEDDNKFGAWLNYGGTGYTALTSRHVYEHSPEIALTVGSLGNNKAYQVYVQTFVNTGSEFYGGRYGFASGQLTSYFYSSGGSLIATGNNGPSGQGQFQIREFDLGTQLSSAGQLTFYFDDFNATSRPATFVALRLVPVAVPEPSTGVLAHLQEQQLLAGGRVAGGIGNLIDATAQRLVIAVRDTVRRTPRSRLCESDQTVFGIASEPEKSK